MALRRHREGDLGHAAARRGRAAAWPPRPPSPRRRSLQRRDTARLTGALALAASFAPSLLRRRRQEQLSSRPPRRPSAPSRAPRREVAVMRLANRIEGGEPAARAVLVGTGALATLAELSASPVSGVALAGTVARVGGICALVGAVAPVRDRAAPLEDPRTAAAALAVGAAAFAGWRQLAKRARAAARALRAVPGRGVAGDRQRRRGQPAPARGAGLRGHALPRPSRPPGSSATRSACSPACAPPTRSRSAAGSRSPSSSASARSTARGSSSAPPRCAATSAPSRSRRRSTSRAATSPRSSCSTSTAARG